MKYFTKLLHLGEWEWMNLLTWTKYIVGPYKVDPFIFFYFKCFLFSNIFVSNCNVFFSFTVPCRINRCRIRTLKKTMVESNPKFLLPPCHWLVSISDGKYKKKLVSILFLFFFMRGCDLGGRIIYFMWRKIW